jgi:hypothetical protein
MLGGNSETVAAIKASLNKEIKHIDLDSAENRLNIHLVDGTILQLWDDGQSCCESRYMSCDDDLSLFIGDTLLDFELKNAPDLQTEYDTHEVQFLDVITSKSRFQIANHNVHNGYYGGFGISARLTATPE